MKTKIEKTVEQIALENYVWKAGTAKFFKDAHRLAFIVGLVVYLLCIIFYAYDSWIWNHGGGIFLCLLLSLIPAAMVGAMTSAIYSFFIDFYRGERKIKRMIASLSQDEKRNIIKTYLESEIKKWEDNIRYYKREIISSQKPINHSINEIKKLQSELEKL